MYFDFYTKIQDSDFAHMLTMQTRLDRHDCADYRNMMMLTCGSDTKH